MSDKTSTFFSPPPPSGPIKPYTGTFGQKQLHHLLRRTLFGVSAADLKAFQGKSMTAVVDALLNVSATQPAPPVKSYSDNGVDKYDVANDNTIPANANYSKWTGLKMGDTWVNYRANPKEANNPDNRRFSSLKAWWLKLMLEQERNIREKMTLFWHNHFAIELADVSQSIIFYNHIALLRKSALGNFRKLVYDVTLDPAMLTYLNGNTNDGSKATSVNENYARELQELFTVGKGAGSAYTEDDVKAAARVLSGWDTPRGADSSGNVVFDPAIPYFSKFNAAKHDKTDKAFSAFYGNKVIKGDSTVNGGINEITQLLDMIFANIEVSKFICRKLFTFFTYYKIDADIETNVIEPLAELLRTSKYEIKPVLKALFTSEYFYKQEYMGAMVKSPLDFVVGHMRMMEFTLPSDPKAFEAQYFIAMSLVSDASRLGQNLGDPPNVAGWAAYYQEPLFYEAWLDSSAIQNRISFQNKNGVATGTMFVNAESKNITIPLPYFKVISGTSTPNDLNIVISDLATLMYSAPLSQATKDKVKARFFALSGNGLKTDAQWTTAVNALLADPNTTNVNALAFKANINKLFGLMFFAAEYQLH